MSHKTQLSSLPEQQLLPLEVGQDAISTASGKVIHSITSKQLAEHGSKRRYLIEEILPVGEPGCISGPSKSLKTTLAIDLAISVASGKPFLGKFPVAETGNVLLISGESGVETLFETAGRICRAKGLELSQLDESLRWATSLPRIPREIEDIRRTIEQGKIKLLVIDPAYFALREVGHDLANATKIGAALEPLTEVCRELGCTVILVAHNRKGRGADQRRFDPPRLEEIAGAGIDQWVRHWLLIGPRDDWDAEAGKHWLWMVSGGSAGHAGEHALNIVEGKPSDEGGRTWQCEVLGMAEANRLKARQKTDREAERSQRTKEGHVQKLRATLQACVLGESKKQLREKTNLDDSAFNRAMATLIERGEARIELIKKGGRACQGYFPVIASG